MKTAINLRHLRVFIAVAEAGNFTRAAEQLLLSQSSLTVTMRQLEEDLGVTLLNRTTRQVQMTADGEKFLGHARHVVEEFDRMISAMHLSASQLGGIVRVAVLPSVAIRLLPPIMKQFHDANPDTRIVLRDDNARGLHRQIRENEVDFGISNMWHDYPELEYVPLTRDRVGVVCRRDDPLTKKKGAISWHDLDPEKLFIMASDTGVYTTLKERPELDNLLATPAGEVLVMVTLLEMARAGLGVTVLPELAKPSDIDSDLVFLPLVNPVVERKLCLIRRRNEPLSTGARKVWEALRGRIPKVIETI
ncbi:MAG: LysR family transcriptional regulator [Rhodospirillales bacterium]|jgi:LysR family transcriptional regulator, carnitine catabolism transcriptional activator|nr:LysR family transcriptional regulator [Rhodospirillales bacterium]